jgi:hypothetical protein
VGNFFIPFALLSKAFKLKAMKTKILSTFIFSIFLLLSLGAKCNFEKDKVPEGATVINPGNKVPATGGTGGGGSSTTPTTPGTPSTPKIYATYKHHTKVESEYTLDQSNSKLPLIIIAEEQKYSENYGEKDYLFSCPTLIDPLNTAYTIDAHDILYLYPPDDFSKNSKMIRLAGTPLNLTGIWSSQDFLFKTEKSEYKLQLLYAIEFADDGRVFGHSFCQADLYVDPSK